MEITVHVVLVNLAVIWFGDDAVYEKVWKRPWQAAGLYDA